MFSRAFSRSLLPVFCRSWVIVGLFWASLSILSAAEIRLTNDFVTVTCDPARLALTFAGKEQPPVQLTAAWEQPETNTPPVTCPDLATWQLPTRGLRVTLQLTTNCLQVNVTAEKPSTLAWPVFRPATEAQGWILPMFEGIYVASGESPWREALLEKDHTYDTTADFPLPFWGVDYGKSTVTCQLLNPFNNEVRFATNGAGLELQLTHTFPRSQTNHQFALRLVAGAGSPIEPAREYRRWLEAHGEFVSLDEKIKHTPAAEKLLGAIHAYLWGGAILISEDVSDWKGLGKQLLTESKSEIPSPGRHLWASFSDEAKEMCEKLPVTEWPDRYMKSVVAGALNDLLGKTNFYSAAAWKNIPLDEATTALVQRDDATLTPAELCQRNSGLFYAAYKKYLKPPTTWGDGHSPQMIETLAAAGMPRLWLGADGWEGFVQRPETVRLAREKGFLIGTYDSYHSMHSPTIKPDETWATAQFDEELYRTGAIIKADGKPKGGFKGRGFNVSPQAVRPWVEKRVSGLMKIFPANTWFMDCDGFGEFYDDYSPLHPATQASDLAERAARCAWIRDTYGAVLGTEGCSAGMASTVHFAHGVLTPVIGWGDPDLDDKEGKYFLGRYYPNNEPAAFFKPVPIKPKYRDLYYNPAVRLPLFQTVFHDSVVATHHWSNPSLKFPEVAGTTELLELLYSVPPLYHWNRAEFARRQKEVKRHYDFFSPLHREIGRLPLTDFRWLTADRQVQQTTFGDRVTLTANFGSQPYTQGAVSMPAHSLVATWSDKSHTPVTYQVK